MRQVLFLCDGASTPGEWRGKWTKTDRLVTEGERSTVNFTIKPLEGSLHGSLDARSSDLVRIAAFVLAADQSVSRGGDADPTLHNWHRRMGLVIPVNDPDFWGSSAVLGALRECVGFVSDDDWDFRFSQRTEGPRQVAFDDVVAPDAEADVVIPFSGGIDSLTAVVEALRAGQRPMLIWHSSSNVLEGTRRQLLEALRSIFPQQPIGRISARAHRVGPEQVEESNRSRSFFFASLAAVVANRFKTAGVYLADNGWVSVNPRINDQMIGARGTRSTHPRFLRLFNELASLVFEDAPPVQNPFWDQTRADVMVRLRAAGCEGLLPTTRSCSAGRNKRRETPHCGECSQCIDRRFSSIAAGLQEFDPGEAYAFDVMRDALKPDTESLVMSYIRAARKIDRLSRDALFYEFPELADCVVLDDGEDEADAYATLFHRQAAAVLDVVERQIETSKSDLARGNLPSRNLLVLLAVEQARDADDSSALQASDGYGTIRVPWRSEPFTFTPPQAVVIRNLDRARQAGTSPLSSEEALAGSGRDGDRMSNVFKKHPAWNTLVRTAGRKYYLDPSSPKSA